MIVSICSSIFQYGNMLMNSSGSCPAQTSFMVRLVLPYFSLRYSVMVFMAALLSECHLIKPDPVEVFVSLASCPTSGHQPCHNHNTLLEPPSKKNSAEINGWNYLRSIFDAQGAMATNGLRLTCLISYLVVELNINLLD